MPVRNGSDYIRGLRDSREVWLNGEAIEDITTDVRTKEAVASLARLYDMQASAEFAPDLTYRTAEGDRCATSFLMPERPEDVARRGRAFGVWAGATGGLMGRSPDYLNSLVTAWAAASDFFGRADPRYGQNVLDYYEHCRVNDLALTHAITDPQVDRSRSPHEQDDPYTVLGIVKETSEGIIVRGAKMLATLAPYADELLIYSFMPLKPDDAAYALAFAVPVAAPGLRVLCRQPFASAAQREDQPLASQFDEMDAMVIFDDVVIPWERVFIKGDVQAANGLRAGTDMPAFLAHQATARGLAKAEFTFGVATMITEAIGTQAFPPVQEKLGELVGYVEMIRSCVRFAEQDPELSPRGIYLPKLDALNVAMTTFPRVYPRMIELLQLLGSSGLIMTPSHADMVGERAADIDKYVRGAVSSSADKLALFKIAADLAIGSFGGRQVLYERFYAGDLSRLLAGNFNRYDKSRAIAAVNRVMESLAVAV